MSLNEGAIGAEPPKRVWGQPPPYPSPLGQLTLQFKGTWCHLVVGVDMDQPDPSGGNWVWVRTHTGERKKGQEPGFVRGWHAPTKSFYPWRSHLGYETGRNHLQGALCSTQKPPGPPQLGHQHSTRQGNPAWRPDRELRSPHLLQLQLSPPQTPNSRRLGDLFPESLLVPHVCQPGVCMYVSLCVSD